MVDSEEGVEQEDAGQGRCQEAPLRGQFSIKKGDWEQHRELCWPGEQGKPRVHRASISSARAIAYSNNEAAAERSAADQISRL